MKDVWDGIFGDEDKEQKADVRMVDETSQGFIGLSSAEVTSQI